MHVIAAKAVAFKLALQPEFRAYMQRTLDNAQALAAALAARGFVRKYNHLLLQFKTMYLLFAPGNQRIHNSLIYTTIRAAY
jgi:hypothetical protein